MPEASNRRCDSCNGAMPARQSRQRDEQGRLVCDSCKSNPQPQWTTTHAALSVVDASEMQRREAEALASIVRVRKAKHRQAVADDPKSEVYVLTVPGQEGYHPTIQWDEKFGKWTCTDSGGRHGVADSPQRLLRTMKGRFGDDTTMSKQAMRRMAHDSGDQAILNHCPFCGSGAVTGGSDGTTTCDFCHTSFTVQVQPTHPYMPQTVDGQPQHMPGMPEGQETELSGPTDPTVEEESEDVAADPLGEADPNPPSNPTQSKPPFPPKGGPEDEEDKPKGNQPPWLKNKRSSRSDGGLIGQRTAVNWDTYGVYYHDGTPASVNDVVQVPGISEPCHVTQMDSANPTVVWVQPESQWQKEWEPGDPRPRMVQVKAVTPIETVYQHFKGRSGPPSLGSRSFRTAEVYRHCAHCGEDGDLSGPCPSHRDGSGHAVVEMPVSDPEEFHKFDRKSFRTTDGRTLDADAYMARLALEHADDREAVLDAVRLGHLQKEQAAGRRD